jgi:hypothetical protein
MFLDAVEAGLSGDDPVMGKMFTDSKQGSTLGVSSEHTGLLWALELLCWAPEHLSRCAGALARLSQIDPDGRLANRPEGSLRTVFLPWIPQTSASLTARFEVLEGLRSQYPDVAWKLEMAMLPGGYDVSTFTPRPRFRQWPTTDERAPLSEWLEAVAKTTTLAIEDAGHDPRRWAEFVTHVAGLPTGPRDEVLAALDRLSPEALRGEVGTKLWQTLVALVARHRDSPDARWAFDDETLKHLEAVAEKLEPDDLVGRFAPLFDWNPPLSGVPRQDYEARERCASQARADAVRCILDSCAYPGIERLAQAAKLPEQVGRSTAEVAPGEHFPEIRGLLGRGGELGRFAFGWVVRMADDSSWLDGRAAEMPGWSVSTQLGFLLALGGPTKRTVILVDSLSQAVQRQFWGTVRPVAIDGEALHDVVDHLLAHDRPWVAIDILSLAQHTASKDPTPIVCADQVVKALDSALADDPADAGAASRAAYEVGQLLDYLERASIDEVVIARFEWGYFRVLEHIRQPRALYRALSDDPKLFVDLVCRVYRPKKAPSFAKADEPAVAIAQNAWSVLHAWRPRLNEVGGIHSDKLASWVEKTRAQLADLDRADIGDQQIGQTLSGTLPAADGIWPAEEIRELIERLKSTNLESGLGIGVLNSRGVTTRALYDGGAQEWSLAAKYRGWSDAVINRWPRTGRVLTQLADDYERQARREDMAAHALANDV